jgi:hypothetical protein
MDNTRKYFLLDWGISLGVISVWPRIFARMGMRESIFFSVGDFLWGYFRLATNFWPRILRTLYQGTTSVGPYQHA